MNSRDAAVKAAKLTAVLVLGYFLGGLACWWAIQKDLSDGSIDLLTYTATGCKIERK